MDAERKKKLKEDYSRAAVVGGVYAIVCSGDNSRCIKSTPDIRGIKNRFDFAKMTGGCPDPMVRSEWTKFGVDSLSLVVLETLTKKETQTSKEFADDIELLLNMWKEKAASDSEGK